MNRHLMVILSVQKVLASSSANIKPPMGLRNPATTPAAAPQHNMSRLLMSFLNLLGNSALGITYSTPGMLASHAPTTAPMWIIGPSTPTYMPLATANAVRINLLNPVRIVVRLIMFTPFNYAFTSAIPPPAAALKY